MSYTLDKYTIDEKLDKKAEEIYTSLLGNEELGFTKLDVLEVLYCVRKQVIEDIKREEIAQKSNN